MSRPGKLALTRASCSGVIRPQAYSFSDIGHELRQQGGGVAVEAEGGEGVVVGGVLVDEDVGGAVAVGQVGDGGGGVDAEGGADGEDEVAGVRGGDGAGEQGFVEG